MHTATCNSILFAAGVGIGFNKTEYERRWGWSGVDALKYILATDDNDLIKTSTSPSSLNRISELVIQQINSQCEQVPTQPPPSKWRERESVCVCVSKL